MQSDKNTLITPFTIITKLHTLSIVDEKHFHQSSYVDLYYPLENPDVCLKIHDIEKLNNFKIEIEIRNRHKEQQSSSSFIQHWSIYEIKYPRIDLSDKLLHRLDQLTIEKITKYLQRIITEENLFNRLDLSTIKIQKHLTKWQIDDSDRQIEETDIDLMTNDDISQETNELFYVPKHWRTISIQASDYDKLFKILTTLQIENDKDLLDYFSFLLSQTRLNSFPIQQQQPSSEQAYMNLLTMNYASFIELIQRIHRNHIGN